MKNVLLISLLSGFAGIASALTPAADNFDLGTINANRWIYQKGGKGTLSQSGGLLRYIAATPVTQDDFASLTLRNNNPGFNESWQVTLDVSNTANKGDNVGVGIMIFNQADPTDNVNLEFYGSGANGGFNFIGVTNDFDDITKDVRVFPNVTKGSIRVSYSATTRLFTFSYDTTGSADGFQWNKLCTFSPTGVGGTRRGNWRMNPDTGSFGVSVFGYSDGVAVASGKASMNNFRLKAAN